MFVGVCRSNMRSLGGVGVAGFCKGSNVDFENDIFPRQLICNGALCLAFWIFAMIDQVDTTTRIIPMVNAAPRLIIKF